MQPGNVFEHYKRGGRYEIVCLALLEATGENMVVYKALYDDGQIWIRPLEEFVEEVEWEGKRVRRFTLVT